MAITTLVIGESGTGKSTSLRTLVPQETFIINVLDKPLPFRGYAQNYKTLATDGTTGNYYASDNHAAIMRAIKLVNEKRPEIKNLIIDDWQYTMANEFMRRATEPGYTKFTEIGQHAWHIIKTLSESRQDLFCFVLAHSETDSSGKIKCKTIGKMLDEKISIEGMFTVVLHAQIVDGAYVFLTQYDGPYVAKSPIDLFEDRYIPNDLLAIQKKLDLYFNEDIAI